MNWLKRIFCRHTGGLAFVRNIYGDEIIQRGYNRSIWKCKRCGRDILMPHINIERQP